MARKKGRGNGTGTVYPRKNKQGKIIGYRGSYFGPDGRRRYVYAKTKTEAEIALRQAMADGDRGLVFDSGMLTVEDYLNRWLTDAVKDTVRRSTFAQYESVVNRHIVPALGRLKLKSLTPAHARALYREKLGTGLSPRTVQYIHATISQTMDTYSHVMPGMGDIAATALEEAPS
jgi:integrase